MAITKIRRIGIVAKTGVTEANKLASNFIDIFLAMKRDVIAVAPLTHKLVETLPLDNIDGKVDIIVVIGGDGTILRTMRVLESSTPILAVKMGGRGVMSEIEPNDLQNIAVKIIEGSYFIDRRMRLVTNISSKTLPPALNEVFIRRAPPTGTPTYTISLGKLTIQQRMDELIISTPTGSTGHSFSIGSPIISEDLNVFLLTPISPISKLPPLILSPEPIEITSNSPSHIIVDGQLEAYLEAGVPVKISKHMFDAFFIRFNNNILRQLIKLGFN